MSAVRFEIRIVRDGSPVEGLVGRAFLNPNTQLDDDERLVVCEGPADSYGWMFGHRTYEVSTPRGLAQIVARLNETSD